MAFTILDNDESFASNPQSIWMETDINAIIAGIGGDGVVSGCAVTAQGSPNMTVAVASGTVRVAGVQAAVTSGNVTITAADVTNPRIDLVVVDNAGSKSATAGTAAANPKAPDIPASSVLLAMVYVPANDTAIATNQITDKRLLLNNIAGLAGTFNANTFLGGPTSGSAAAPTQRTLVSADGTALNDASNGSLIDHFFNTAPTSGTYGALNLVADVSGSGASVGIIAPPDASANGVERLSSGTTTTGRAGVRTALNAIRFSGGAEAYACRFQIPTLLDGTESGAIYVGFGDDLTAAPTDGAYLYWDNTQTNFRYRTRSNSTETDIDSGLPPVAATWYTVSVAVNAAGTSVTFTINGGNSQSSTTNIPTAAGRETGLIANIIKSAGTTARFLYLDLMRWAWAGY